ncbi:PadR family transcriptional regulator [Ornithinimicrobium flavum]|uniref:PadR family transcriptional regulator n=1 Tax=Ornithinimicrobium flavum TaxID=1288636 RepID=UPI0010703996|nr:PadR family transcriptional regulator [Ornithinimicrobium flavum]
MTRNQGGFGGFNVDPDQIFGPHGILNQVFGQQGGAAWGGRAGQRSGPFGPGGPFGGGGPFDGRGPGGRSGAGRRARRGDVRNAILHLLQREPMNGYQLMQEIAQSSGGAWQPSSGAIYPALAQLEDEGLVEQVQFEGRRAYQLTEAGRQAAADLPHQSWAGGAEPEDPWGEGGPTHASSRHRHRGWAGAETDPEERRSRRHRGAQLWKALGSVAMATQAVGQAGDDALSGAAADLLDRTRRDLYRLLAEAEVERSGSPSDDDGDDDVTEGELLED